MGDISAENRKLLDKIVLEGKLFRLDRKEIKKEEDIDNWVNGFIGSFDSVDRRIINNHKYIWKEKDLDLGNEQILQ